MMHTRTQTESRKQSISYKNVMLKTLHLQQVFTCFYLLRSLNFCEMNSFSRMTHPLKINPRLQCYDVLDFGLNPISNQIFYNEFYELKKKIQEQAYKSTYKQEVRHRCLAWDPKHTKAQMIVKTQI